MSETVTRNVKQWVPPSAVANFDALYPGWAHRFVDKTEGNKRGDRLQYWLNQGYEIAPYGNEGMAKNRSTGASSPDGAVHYRGLVLVRAPRELANARNQHYREKHQRIMGASQRVRDLREASGQANREAKRRLTSAFGEAHVTKGDRVLENSSVDTDRRDSERSMRDVDPQALRELQDRVNEMAETHRKQKVENDRLRAEIAERKAKPSDRRRKIFPVS